MPRFCRRAFGPRVITRPQASRGATSPGQQVWMGRRLSSTSAPSQTISWQAALRTVLGLMSHRAAFSMDTLASASRRPLGASGSRREASSSPVSRRAPTSSAPMPQATRRGVPNRLASTGMSAGASLWRAFSNSRAGPPARSTRSAISVISSRVETGAVMRLSSPWRSSWARKSRRSRYFKADPGKIVTFLRQNRG
ncbi:Uncharacterised protein [Bordetella pertussis]|nr:Uncharacterised protein [Bordetella pertussis]